MADVLEGLSTPQADRYREEREIGRGGVAQVFLSHDLKLDRADALGVPRAWSAAPHRNGPSDSLTRRPAMIQISAVQGDVMVQDVKKQYMEMARQGMVLDSMGSYLIVTTATSRAEILSGGSRVSLPPSSLMRIRGDRTWWERHSEVWSGDAKLFFGRLWAKIARDHRDDLEATNAVIGVRG